MQKQISELTKEVNTFSWHSNKLEVITKQLGMLIEKKQLDILDIPVYDS